MQVAIKAYASSILCTSLAVALLALPTSADVGGDGLPHVSGDHRHPRACRPDDARCLALQRDVCDPWNVTATDKYVVFETFLFNHHPAALPSVFLLLPKSRLNIYILTLIFCVSPFSGVPLSN
jgi:hypothetical protein